MLIIYLRKLVGTDLLIGDLDESNGCVLQFKFHLNQLK